METERELKALATRIRIGAVEEFKARGFGQSAARSVCATCWRFCTAMCCVTGRKICLAGAGQVVCSKGHAGPAIYAALAIEGFYPYEDIKTLNQPGTVFPSHCDRNKTPAST
jgi:transketolase